MVQVRQQVNALQHVLKQRSTQSRDSHRAHQLSIGAFALQVRGGGRRFVGVGWGPSGDRSLHAHD